MDVVKRGSRGTAALMAQMLLNCRLRELGDRNGRPVDALAEDGVFGEKSERALRDFIERGMRVSRPPVIDGGVWRSLGLKLEIDHRAPLIGQKGGGLCWQAAAEMVLGGNVTAGPGSALRDARGALKPDMENLRRFAESYRWRPLQPTTNVAVFASLLRRRPIWMAGQWTALNGRQWGHAVVVSGMWSDGDPTGTTTLLRFHDPYPGPVGRVYNVAFFSAAGVRLPGGIWFRPQILLMPN